MLKNWGIFNMEFFKKKINLIGGGFQHEESTVPNIEPKYIKWIKNDFKSSTTFYIDDSIMHYPNKNTKNYGWLVESKTIIPKVYDWAKNNVSFLKENFISVFTHDVELSQISDIFKLTQCSSKSFIAEDQIKIYNKNKLISLIASNKTMCQEHIFRQNVIKNFSTHPQVSHYGRGYNYLENKIDGLKDYCFSFAMENATYANMFSEKITDCFVCGTIPIYYGIANISDFFNKDGIILLNNNFDINILSYDYYYSKLDAIKENFEIAKNILTAEDYIYINFLKELELE